MSNSQQPYFNAKRIRQDFKLSRLYSYNVFLTLICLACLFLLKPLFIKTTETLFSHKNSITSTSIDVLAGLGIIFILGFVIYKLRLSYKPSFNQYLIYALVLVGYINLRNDPDINWTYDSFNAEWLANLAYLDTIVFSTLAFPLWKIMSFRWLRKYRNFDKEVNQVYFEDQPKEDTPENKKLATKISSAIISDTYHGSFSIGIIGGWGHGKSTFINSVKKEIEENVMERAVIEINFSPFLNHNDDEVITEFFTSFSNELRPYSGRLSHSVINYANSLSKLFKKGEISSFLTKTGFRTDKSAYELYNEINEQIDEIGRKIIVFIDDLDRLNAKEILQVFKLVRNTSNFNNTVFILALDKDYVVKALASDKSYMESKFIDKFFQLEIYLPEIDKVTLMKFVLVLLKKSEGFLDKNISKFESCFFGQNILLNDYVKNYRDAIRLANQIIYEHSVLDDLSQEVAIKDFVNLIFLKNRYPVIFQDLCANREKYLMHEKGFFSLKKEGQKDDDLFINLNLSAFSQGWGPEVTQFELNQSITATKSDYDLTSSEQNLLLRTLAELFGHDSPSHNSIMHERVFWKLMRLRHGVDDLMEDEFLELIINNKTEALQKLEVLISQNKSGQLLSRLNTYTTTSKSDLNAQVLILFYLWRNADRHQLLTSEIIRLLSRLLNLNNQPAIIPSDLRLTPDETKTITDAEFLNEPSASIKARAFLIALLKESETQTELWGYSLEEIQTVGIDLFEEYLSSYRDSTWGVNDFTCYNHYHTLKKVCDPELLNTKFIEYLKIVDPSVFCAQVLERESFSSSFYKIGEFVVELFGNFMTFKTFLEEHDDANMPDMIEFRRFFDLMEIVSFNRYLKYIFKYLKLRDYASFAKISKIEQERSDQNTQIFIKFNSSIIAVPSYQELSYGHRRDTFVNNGNQYLFAATSNAEAENFINQIFVSLKNKMEEEFYPQGDSELSMSIDFEDGTGKIEDSTGLVLTELVSFQHGAEITNL